MARIWTSHAVKDIDDDGVTRRTECGMDWAGINEDTGEAVRIPAGHRGRATWRWIEWLDKFGTAGTVTLVARNGRRISAMLCMECEGRLLDEGTIA